MSYTADEELCVNADKSAVVPCEGPEAAWVLVGPGGTLTDEQAAKYGFAEKGKKVALEVEVESEPEQKAVEAAPENKAVFMSPVRKGKK